MWGSCCERRAADSVGHSSSGAAARSIRRAGRAQEMLATLSCGARESGGAEIAQAIEALGGTIETGTRWDMRRRNSILVSQAAAGTGDPERRMVGALGARRWSGCERRRGGMRGG